MKTRSATILLSCLFLACQGPSDSTLKDRTIRLITLDPGHFHAALVQKFMLDRLDSNVYVFAPDGPDVQLHLSRIDAFNSRDQEPTHWNQQVYTGDDFLEKMLRERPGNVVVISGNNKNKTDYITRSLESGLHVLADKPMAIDAEDFHELQEAFDLAKEKKLLLYDIMTERYEITSILQRELAMIDGIFGDLQSGTKDQPAVVKESVHHFFKIVSGKPLVRPPWFFDVAQQGEGIVDVTTHLVDLIQWTCFPDSAIDTTNVHVYSARRWPTVMARADISRVTEASTLPEYLEGIAKGDSLEVYCNGSIDYEINGIHARVAVSWKFSAPEGGGDTHFSIMRGSKANLIIRQGADQNFIPTLLIEPVQPDPLYEAILREEFQTIQEKFAGVTLAKRDNGFEVMIPASYREGHEEHFARVMEKFLGYLHNNDMPGWEIPNMIAKYYTTTKALEIAREREPNL